MHPFERRLPLLMHYMLGNNPVAIPIRRLHLTGGTAWHTSGGGIPRRTTTPVPGKTFADLVLEFRDSMFNYYGWTDTADNYPVVINMLNGTITTPSGQLAPAFLR